MFYLSLADNIRYSCTIVLYFVTRDLKCFRELPLIEHLTVLSHEVAIKIEVGECTCPLSEIEEIPSDGGLGTFTSLS